MQNDNFVKKIEFYILSLCLLFALIFILTVKIPGTFPSELTFDWFWQQIRINWLAMIAFLMASSTIFITIKLKHEFNGAHNPLAEITSVKNENYEHLTFLTTYIIPMICINLEDIRYVIVLGILLVIIGLIFVKTDLYLGNPTLALLGYHLYRIEAKDVSSVDGILVISQDKLSVGTSIKWIRITDFVWVAKEYRENDG